MKVGFLMLTIAALLPSGGRFDARAEAPAALERIKEQDPLAAPVTLKFIDQFGSDGITKGKVVLLSGRALDAIHSREELDALLAMVVVFAQHPDGGVTGPARPSLQQYAGLLAYAIAADAIDPLHESDPQEQGRRRYDLPGRAAASDEPGTPRGRAALGLISRLHSCSGAALDVLDRLNLAYSALPEDKRPPLFDLAIAMRGQFGILASPPDTSCVHDENS